MLQIDKRVKSFRDFGKSMKYYSISMWVFQAVNVIVNIFAIIGIAVYLYMMFSPSSMYDYSFSIIIIFYMIIMGLLILLYLISALVNFIFFVNYLVKLSNSSNYDKNKNLKKSFIMEIISIVLSIILPLTLEMLGLFLGFIIPKYNYTFNPLDIYDNIWFDLTYTAFIVTIILYSLRIIIGYIPRILKAFGQKKLRKWTNDLFEFPVSSNEKEKLEPSIIEGSQLMKIGQVLGIFRIVRIFGKIMYIVGLGKTGKGLIKSFEIECPKGLVNERNTRVSQIKNMVETSDIPLFCAYCGLRLFPNSQFCGKCGKALKY